MYDLMYDSGLIIMDKSIPEESAGCFAIKPKRT